MVTQWTPIAYGEYAAGTENAGENAQQYQVNGYRILQNFNFCENCPEDGTPIPLQDAVYSSYMQSILCLLAVIISFRVALVLVLKFQEIKFG
jgi:hypothetical protein